MHNRFYEITLFCRDLLLIVTWTFALIANMLVLVLLISTVFILICYWYARPHNEPPGPRGFPILGIMPYLNKHPERLFAKWSEHYGPVMTVPMGPQKWVILNDYTSIYEVIRQWRDLFQWVPRTLQLLRVSFVCTINAQNSWEKILSDFPRSLPLKWYLVVWHHWFVKHFCKKI